MKPRLGLISLLIWMVCLALWGTFPASAAQGPSPTTTTAPLPSANPTATPLVIVVTATPIPAAVPTPETDSPEKAIREWFQALADLDGFKLADRTCKAEQENLQKGGLYATLVNIAAEDLIRTQVKFDVSKVVVKTLKQDGDFADVQVTGSLRAAVGLNVISQPLLEVWLAKREGKLLSGKDSMGRPNANWIGPIPASVLDARIQQLLGP